MIGSQSVKAPCKNKTIGRRAGFGGQEMGLRDRNKFFTNGLLSVVLNKMFKI